MSEKKRDFTFESKRCQRGRNGEFGLTSAKGIAKSVSFHKKGHSYIPSNERVAKSK